MTSFEKVNWVHAQIQRATRDEVEIIFRFVSKVMGEGRNEHGKLDLSNERRSVRTLLAEAIDEQLDGVFYSMAADMLLEAKEEA